MKVITALQRKTAQKKLDGNVLSVKFLYIRRDVSTMSYMLIFVKLQSVLCIVRDGTCVLFCILYLHLYDTFFLLKHRNVL